MRFVLALLGLLALFPSGAKAAAIAAVDTNFFSLTALQGVDQQGALRALNPGEVTFSILSQTLSPIEIARGTGVTATAGGATTDGESVYASVSAFASATRPGHALASVALDVVVAIELAADSDLLAIAILTDFSAFNPGGNPVGASVDNVAGEFARFASSQLGEGIGDTQGCHTGILSGGHLPIPLPSASCGVPSPDSSQGEFFFVVPEGNVGELAYRLSVEVEASAVPEPATLAILGAALCGLSLLRRRL